MYSSEDLERFIQYLVEQYQEEQPTRKAVELVLEDFIANTAPAVAGNRAGGDGGYPRNCCHWSTHRD